MAKKLRIVAAQLNLKIGDIDGNLKKHIEAALTARDVHKADLIVFSELSLTGYPPEDLLLRKSFLQTAADALNEFKAAVTQIYCVIGHPYVTSQGLLNSCSLIHNGTVLARYHKQHLPNYGVFDEARYFIPGNMPTVVSIHGIPVGLLVCEDLWFSGPVHQAATQGARLILVPNASPFETDKHEKRLEIIQKAAKNANAPIVYVNSVGGQDDLVFDGGSMVVNHTGTLCQFAGFMSETLMCAEIDVSSAETKIMPAAAVIPSVEKRTYDALVLGLRDYVNKNDFKKVYIGVSGGIDSALTAAIAVDALGKDAVHGVFMPSEFTASISQEDAKQLADHLKIDLETLSIEPSYLQFIDNLKPSFKGLPLDVTEENIQSRCRVIILMALANKFNGLVLSTSNRSELAVGYTTIYGDLSGGYAVLKDVPKTMVYRLAQYRNQINFVIPERTLQRPPTAELAPHQLDEDSLPPYPLLDQILDLYLNQEKGVDEIIALGLNAELVSKIVKMIKHSEYKRRQAPIGPHINHKSFGRDWRYPLTSGFKG